ncbi:ABC transporter ATP-binding protein [Kribbella catacumbae]|uniref:ABC transporter ATP-binding protein n=1 Tax=Kribbella catacumbae TaxID=460086 RepID=UPI0003A76D03|nr:ABC transporter ATP-binding protein [Kribbella catacumbae]
MSAPVLETSGLGRRYRSVWALRDCDLALPAGRVIALVGPNGAGKTTFLRLTVGLLRPTEGEITVLGSPAGRESADSLADIGFVAQDHPLYKRFLVRDLLRTGAALNLRWDQALAENRLEALEIPLDQRVGTLSGGQHAQVALTLALAKRPKLLVLDEPVAGLDPLARLTFLQALMGAVAEEELTVLLSSHILPELERVCDYLIVLTGGRVQLAGEIDELLSAHRLLIGPSEPTMASAPGVIHVSRGDRQANAIVRTDGGPVLAGWESRPIGLEELVLAYLHRTPPIPSTR